MLTQKWVFYDFKTAYSLSPLINITALVLEKAQRYFINCIHVYVPVLNYLRLKLPPLRPDICVQPEIHTLTSYSVLSLSLLL